MIELTNTRKYLVFATLFGKNHGIISCFLIRTILPILYWSYIILVLWSIWYAWHHKAWISKIENVEQKMIVKNLKFLLSSVPVWNHTGIIIRKLVKWHRLLLLTKDLSDWDFSFHCMHQGWRKRITIWIVTRSLHLHKVWTKIRFADSCSYASWAYVTRNGLTSELTYRSLINHWPMTTSSWQVLISLNRYRGLTRPQTDFSEFSHISVY